MTVKVQGPRTESQTEPSLVPVVTRAKGSLPVHSGPVRGPEARDPQTHRATHHVCSSSHDQGGRPEAGHAGRGLVIILERTCDKVRRDEHGFQCWCGFAQIPERPGWASPMFLPPPRHFTARRGSHFSTPYPYRRRYGISSSRTVQILTK